MKLLVFLAVWKRPEITEVCFMGIKRLQNYSPTFHVEPFAVISEESMIPLCERYGVEWCMHENLPLGAKKNFGLSQLRDKDFDFMMEIGSDDLILGELLNQYEKFFVKYDFFGITDAAYINAETLECARLQSDAVYGAGRVISKKALEKMDYSLWGNRNRGMDKSSLTSLYNSGFKYWQIPSIDYPLVIDIKSPVNIWPFRIYRQKGVQYDINEIFSRISEQEVNAIKCLPQVYQSANLIEG
jgi:hypothetical protein